ncbi:MAG: hypothetical protein JSR18_01080 [Proteobacteria bacterium]|nr:hypothetical protein [Pseudomonadota bacterium]
MPTARELLEQADALMRRNRGRDTMSPAMGPRTMAPVLAPRASQLELPPRMEVPPQRIEPSPRVEPAARVEPVIRTEPAPRVEPPRVEVPPRVPAPVRAEARPLPGPEGGARPEPSLSPASPAPISPRDIPVLTEPVVVPPAATQPPVRAAAPSAPASAASVAAVAAARPPSARAFASTEVPVLTDAIEEIDAALVAEAAQGDNSVWGRDDDRGEDSVLGPAPKSIAVIPEAPVVTARPNPHIALLAEEVRMQVLQRIDMFTDTGLREALGERLKPIVDRASADLVATINQHVGELLRTYVAEAIERELDRLRTSD